MIELHTIYVKKAIRIGSFYYFLHIRSNGKVSIDRHIDGQKTPPSSELLLKNKKTGDIEYRAGYPSNPEWESFEFDNELQAISHLKELQQKHNEVIKDEQNAPKA